MAITRSRSFATLGLPWAENLTHGLPEISSVEELLQQPGSLELAYPCNVSAQAFVKLHGEPDDLQNERPYFQLHCFLDALPQQGLHWKSSGAIGSRPYKSHRGSSDCHDFSNVMESNLAATSRNAFKTSHQIPWAYVQFSSSFVFKENAENQTEGIESDPNVYGKDGKLGVLLLDEFLDTDHSIAAEQLCCHKSQRHVNNLQPNEKNMEPEHKEKIINNNTSNTNSSNKGKNGIIVQLTSMILKDNLDYFLGIPGRPVTIWVFQGTNALTGPLGIEKNSDTGIHFSEEK
ncbi:hypothetical protein TURU_098459 [Turdus rufiventris]|nr:hypothetical protein TURU_098459 [Turdus rufiventris]